ncbi:peroxidase [Leisingera aquaemixtae]|uniref:peroxidase family protein n=1 Tax=Leisingera aquaemixtae TaxID=1396826 RepID=UPI001C9771FF|nr:peroxidase family protein [Leisingera aquaemixtae]MBY6069307.1 peroxidase [Leisingera aquaemixtae]
MSSLQIGAPRPSDGTSANPDNPDWGATGTELLRMAGSALGPDGEMAGADRPNARVLSNLLSAQDGETVNAAGASDFLWIWGQFLDHDLSLTGAESGIEANIEVPAGDPFFDPFGTGEAIIPFTRVEQHEGEFLNEITACIDASMIYGSTEEMVAAMRDEGGKLKMTEEHFLNLEGDGFLTGDVRAAENVALTSMHTLFTREHNRLVEELAARDPLLTDDELFEAARARVEALVQAITFKEFLPILLGDDAFGAYQGYDPDVNPGIAIEFSGAVYRLGHTLLSANLQRVTENGTQLDPLALRDAFFQPHLVSQDSMIENVLRGAATQTSEAIDTQVVEDVRSFLFGPPGAGGLDLAALNIQRGRDMGVASYNDLREALGLSRAETFSDITSDAALAAKLELAYGDTDLVDAWTGGLAEDAIGNGLLGETFALVMIDQFTRLRDGDPFWSEGREGIPAEELKALWDTSLSDVILRNTDVQALQKDVFAAMNRIAGTVDDDLLAGGSGQDFIFGRRGDDVLAGLAGADDLQGGGGRDSLAGGTGADCLDGGAGADRLAGGKGWDELSGGGGRDRLLGNRGNDTLDGGAGRDTLKGGMGDDYLTGGAGADCFVFNSQQGCNDTVSDFELGTDFTKITGPHDFTAQAQDTENGLMFTFGNNCSVTFEGITLDDWLDSGASFF